jgi:8-oxo-dGTP pyrophosphatase MutT (NUDIX family)
MTQGIDVTVAAVIERDGRFLFVEELVGGKLVLNQPAGHVERGESVIEAVVRETLEESGFEFEPQHLIGIYHWQADGGPTFLRLAFCGHGIPPPGAVRLDEGIVATHWLTRPQLLARLDDLRSPMVLRCLDDYLAGVRLALDTITHLGDVQVAAAADVAAAAALAAATTTTAPATTTTTAAAAAATPRALHANQ